MIKIDVIKPKQRMHSNVAKTVALIIDGMAIL